ncbi:thiamine pyrophosphate-dependent enzyme [Thermodesulfobacteriota bacterium]
MAGFYNVLRIEDAACPPECNACIEACAQRGAGNTPAVIRSIRKPETKFNSVATCLQCSQPKCLEVCPTEAITKGLADGIVSIKEEDCTACGSCVEACPYDQVYINEETDIAFKCDLCDGHPKCVEACPYGVISFLKPGETRQHLGQDTVAHGVYMCQGCAAESAFRFTQRVVEKVTGQPAIYFGTSSCMALIYMTAGPGRTFLGNSIYYCRMTNVASSMTGARRYFRKIGKDVPLIAFAGDGATVDIGFQNLSGAAERGENLVYICYDNHGYMNTGIQRSGSTPLGAWTTTTPVGGPDRGKTRAAKNVPLIMAFHGISYTATASPAYLEDYARKLTKALTVKDGLAYIHLNIPCTTGWRFPINSSVKVARMAVETNMFPLWEAENGQFRITYRPKKARPVADYTRLQGRFSHLEADKLDKLQKEADNGFALIQNLTQLGRQV